MAIMRVHKTKDYTVMSNYHFREKEMSLKAKGLLSLMLSLPDDWDYSVEGLVAICKESKTAIQSTLKELEQFNYLKRTRKQNAKGQFEYDYDIFENPSIDKPETENPYTENPYTDNMLQLNTNILNTKELNNNNKESKKDTFDDIIENYTNDEEVRDLLKEWLKVRKVKRAALTNRAIQLNLKKLDKLAKESNLSVKDYLEEVIAKGWAAFYAIKSFNNNTNASNTYKRTEIVPEWLNTIQESKPLTQIEQNEMNNLLKEFNDPSFEERKAALQAKLKTKYAK